MTDFTAETRRVLTVAGWRPGRRVDTAGWVAKLRAVRFPVHEMARRFLAEFGGLRIEHGGPGITAARCPVEWDPLLCLGEEDRYADWSRTIGRSLAPLGELDDGRFMLGIDETGRVYLVADWLAAYGPVPEAVESLILGVAPETLHEFYPG